MSVEALSFLTSTVSGGVGVGGGWGWVGGGWVGGSPGFSVFPPFSSACNPAQDMEGKKHSPSLCIYPARHALCDCGLVIKIHLPGLSCLHRAGAGAGAAVYV